MATIRYQAHILVCGGKACSKLADAEAAKKYFKQRIHERNLPTEVRAGVCSCLDYCDDGPNIVVYPEGTLYSGVKTEDWPRIFETHAARVEAQNKTPNETPA